jgi:branched-chain amino acid transport system substrate-binding protein
MNKSLRTAGFATAALILVGCGSTGAETPSSASDHTPGGTKADPSLEPVLIGFTNVEGGAISQPEVRYGFEAGLEYVNAELGGINGHPLEAVECSMDLTPESSANCANEYVDAGVVAATQGYDVASDAALPILKEADTVYIASFAFGPLMNTSKGDAAALMFSNEDLYLSSLVEQQQLGAEKLAVFLEDLPVYRKLNDELLQPAAERLGIEAVPFFAPPNVDYATLAASMLATDPDAVSLPAVQDSSCTGMVQALRSLGFTGWIHASSCSEFIDTVEPPMLENVMVHNEFTYPDFVTISPKAEKDIDIYEYYISQDHPDMEEHVRLGMYGFVNAVNTANILQQVEGKVTAEKVKEVLPTAKGDFFFRDQGYDCGSPDNWPGTTACSNVVVFTSFTADKQRELLPDQPVDLSAVRPTS